VGGFNRDRCRRPHSRRLAISDSCGADGRPHAVPFRRRTGRNDSSQSRGDQTCDTFPPEQRLIGIVAIRCPRFPSWVKSRSGGNGGLWPQSSHCRGGTDEQWRGTGCRVFAAAIFRALDATDMVACLLVDCAVNHPTLKSSVAGKQIGPAEFSLFNPDGDGDQTWRWRRDRIADEEFRSLSDRMMPSCAW
jgi:hypothetical protein